VWRLRDSSARQKRSTPFRLVVWDEDDEAADEAAAEFWAQLYPADPETVALMNEQADALAGHMEAAGVAHTVETDANGGRRVEWDEDDEAANAAADEFYAPTPEEVAEINADSDALATHLTGEGVEFEVVTEDDGTRWVEVDEDDEAANQAVEDYYVAAGDEGDEGGGEVGTEEVACEG
jgi:hypothetical protein